MTKLKRKITKEQYERALQNHGYITNKDKEIIFNVCELYGYGVYSPIVAKEGEEYVVNYYIGETCD